MNADQLRIVRNEETKIIVSSLELLISNEGLILDTPSFSKAASPALGISTAFFGGGSIPLGLALKSWTDGSLLATCPNCGRSQHLFFVAGSPLSGTNFYNGHCMHCKTTTFDASDRNVFEKGLKFLNKLKQAQSLNVAGDPVSEQSGFSVEGAGDDERLFLNERGASRARARVANTPMSIGDVIHILKGNGGTHG